MGYYDYVIVGSGIAGLYTALLAKEHGSVLLVTKGSIDECNTRYAQGGIAAAIGPDDSPALHQSDTEGAGAGLNDPQRRPDRETPTGNDSFELSGRRAAVAASTNADEPHG